MEESLSKTKRTNTGPSSASGDKMNTSNKSFHSQSEGISKSSSHVKEVVNNDDDFISQSRLKFENKQLGEMNANLQQMILRGINDSMCKVKPEDILTKRSKLDKTFLKELNDSSDLAIHSGISNRTAKEDTKLLGKSGITLRRSFTSEDKIHRIMSREMEKETLSTRSKPKNYLIGLSEGKSQSKSETEEIYSANINEGNGDAAMTGTLLEHSNSKRNIHLFKNVYDSFSDEEVSDDHDELPKWIIIPSSPFFRFWDVLTSLLIAYSVIVSPALLAFSTDDDGNQTVHNAYFFIDMFIDFCFLIDLGLTFFSAYVQSNDDKLITSKKKIAVNYLMTFFIFDLMSCIPFNFITYIAELLSYNSDGQTLDLKKLGKIGKSFRIFKWTRIIRLMKLSKMKKKSQDGLISKLELSRSGIHRFLKFAVFFLILIHLTSCLWCFIGKLERGDQFGINWIDYAGYTDINSVDLYIYSIYFHLGTIFTIGYGDIAAVTPTERLYLIFFMTVGCILFSFVLSSLSSIFSQIDARTQIFEKKNETLDHITYEFSLPKKLSDKIRKSIRHEYLKWNSDIVLLLDSLPGALKNKIYLRMYEKQIRNLTFFQKKSYDFILFVVPLLKSMKFFKDDLIISYGEIVDEMYLLTRGVISIQLGYKYNNYEIAMIRNGDHFGDILMYMNDQCNYDFSVRTKYAECFVLNKTNFAQIKLNFKYSVDEILTTSYNFFLRIEHRRKAAMIYYKVNGDLVKFKQNYMDKFIKNNSNLMMTTRISSKSLNQNLILDNLEQGFDLGKGEGKKVTPFSIGIGDSFSEEKFERELLQKSANNRHRSSIDLKFLRKYSKKFNEDDSNLLFTHFASSKNVLAFDDKETDEARTPNRRPKRLKSDKVLPKIQRPFSPEKGKIIYIQNLNINYSSADKKNELGEVEEEEVKEEKKTNKNITPKIKQANPAHKRFSFSPKRVSFDTEDKRSSFATPQRTSLDSASKLIREKTSSYYLQGLISPHNKYLNKDKNIFKFEDNAKKKDKFLKMLGSKIENDALLLKNKEIQQEYLQGFLGMKEGESQMKGLIHKLNKIKKGLTDYVAKKLKRAKLPKKINSALFD